MAQQYHLVSSVTCPWVQRSVIVMRAKGVDFDVTYINLREKPDWFLKISPHGKVPVLKLADGTALFESNAIAEYLDEVIAPQLHPTDPVLRAKNRAWTDFLPTFAWGPGINNVSYAKDREALDAFQLCSRAEGIIPALEPAHALAPVCKIAPDLPKDHLIVMNMCGRGDKDVFSVAEALGVSL